LDILIICSRTTSRPEDLPLRGNPGAAKWGKARATFIFVAALLALVLSANSTRADVSYAHDDGTAERAIGIDPGEDSLLFNRFEVAPGGEVINSISVAYGRPGSTSVLNGLSVSILLYEDLDGGDPFNAVLRRSVSATVANANSNTFNVYPIPPTEVHGTFLAAMLFRNTTAVNRFIGALDQTLPHTSDASFYGYAIGLDETNLSSIPAGQFGTIESIGFPGNWLVRANAQPVPEPAFSLLSICVAGMLCRRRRHRRRFHLTTCLAYPAPP